jgi:Ca-activated chloride channel homolog
MRLPRNLWGTHASKRLVRRGCAIGRLAMKTTLIAAFIASLLPVLQLAAQPRGPQLLAGDEGQAERKPLGLAAADIRVVIAGPVAETTMTLTFRNDTPRVLEGELTFPLPENATVSGFGLDIAGYLVDGVPVERQKARITYEKETRKRVDPGLVEQAVGNNFRTRVYPIPANGKRTVKVQYVSEVTAAGRDGATFRLPLGWGEAIDDVTIEVSVLGASATPTTEGGPKDLRFESRGGGAAAAVARQTYKATKLEQDLTVTLPGAGTRALVEKRTKGATVQEMIEGRAARAGAVEHYFVISDVPPQIAERRLENPPFHVGVLWDASLSRLDSDKTRELALLRKLIASMDPNGAIDLIVFRNEPEPPVTFRVAEADKLFDALSKVTYDGGTNLSLLPIVKNHASLLGVPAGGEWHDFAYWLLFTDGLADLGPEMPKRLDGRVYAIANDGRSNHALLRRIAAQNGGAYLNLQRMSDDDALASIVHEPLMLLGVDAPDGAIADVYPRGAQPAGRRAAITGKLLAPEARLSLKYGIGGTVVHRTEVTLRQSGATETGVVPRFWAQQKVADLSSDVDANADALAAVGREFNLVTPNTSLLVLETVEQYLEHKIVPPKSNEKLYGDFMVRIEQQKEQVAKTREQRIEQVLALWQQRVAWWEKTYQYPKDLKVTNADQVQQQGGIALSGGGLFGGQGVANRDGAGAAGPVTGAANRPAGTPPTAEPRPASPAPEQVLRQAAQRGAAQEREFNVQDQTTELHSNRGANLAVEGRAELGDLRAKLKGESAPLSSAITIKPWDPDVPYLKAMREAGGEAAYAVYLKQRPQYLASPAFYLDCADFLLRSGQQSLGIRVLTNVAELKLEDAQLLRIVAHRLNQIGRRDLAIDLFEKILKMRPEEPQSHRDLALAVSDRADAQIATGGTQSNPAAAVADYRRALDLLNQVVMGHWDRFEEIEVVALMEANRIIAAMDRLQRDKEIPIPLDPRLIKNLDCDVRIVLTWDADLTDVDLWVTEPSGERCKYDHNRTTIGAAMSRDFTQGYGPEEYCLRRAMSGEYKIQANYYGSSQTSLVGPATVQATVITHFGRPDEKRQSLTVRLATQKDVVDVGTITMGKQDAR